ncbi:relaxase/mobilization nuclease domain-containing protein [Elizabethkingia ursingii]
MISSAKSIKGSRKGIDYLIAEHKGYELDRNLVYGETSSELMNSFRVQQTLNTHCEKKFITAFISPDPKDGQKLSDKELKEISRDFMKGIGVNPDKQAYLAIVHTEKQHKHVHLLINRIDENGKAIKDNYIVLKAHDTAHKIAKERGLISAKDIVNEKNNKVLTQSKEIKGKIFEAHTQVMKIKPQTISKYMEYMKAMGYEVKPTINNSGRLQGFRVKENRTGQEFKMSEVKRSMSAEIQKNLKFDLDFREKSASKIFEAHKQVIQMKPQNISKYQDYMKTLGYEVKLTRNKLGRIQKIGISEMKNVTGIISAEVGKGLKTMLNFKEKPSIEAMKDIAGKRADAEFLMEIEQRQIIFRQIAELEKSSGTNSLNKSEEKGLEI